MPDTNNQNLMVQDLLDFIAQSPTPFHATHNLLGMMLDAGFFQLSESDDWRCEPNQGYVVSRNDSSIIAFKTGQDINQGIRMIGAHTDSPCLRIKPNPEIRKHGYLQLGVEVYGGVLLHPWLDRDLSIAGRVSGLDKNGQLSHQLIDIKKAIGIIPNLAIHLDNKANKDKTINKQTDLPLIIAQDQERTFKELLMDYCDSTLDRILEYDLSCYDTQPPSIVGLNEEFICSARLDNLLSSYIGARALIDADSDQACLYISSDHEEVGSASACGADGPFLKSVIERLIESPEQRTKTIDQSLLVSCDNAHGIHPNYADKHDENHGPILNKGPVIKSNSNQRYATNSVSSAKFQAICEQADVPLQRFVVRSDMACGSTIGPITATGLGIETLDIGAPQWAMHSIRETAGAKDCDYLYRSLIAFLAS